MIDDAAAEESVEQENYFVSMTDMMVGLVFIFIILLMYFAVQFKQTTEQLTSADETRKHILEQVQTRLEAKGVHVKIDTANGLLHLPDEILFESAQAIPTQKGKEAIGHLADALREVLPCYAEGMPSRSDCPPTPHRVQSVFIEGHTDTDALTATAAMPDNWDLSVRRATNTFRELILHSPDLQNLCEQPTPSQRCQAILSVSGYGPTRPVDEGTAAEAKAKNRRIDVRILMVPPRVEYPTLGGVADAGARPSR